MNKCKECEYLEIHEHMTISPYFCKKMKQDVSISVEVDVAPSGCPKENKQAAYFYWLNEEIDKYRRQIFSGE